MTKSFHMLATEGGARDSSRSGEVAMLVALMEETQHCLRTSQVGSKNFWNAYRWVFERGCSAPFTFDEVCGYLKLDPAAVRQEFRRDIDKRAPQGLPPIYEAVDDEPGPDDPRAAQRHTQARATAKPGQHGVRHKRHRHRRPARPGAAQGADDGDPDPSRHALNGIVSARLYRFGGVH